MFSHAMDYAEGQFVSGSPTECALLGGGSSDMENQGCVLVNRRFSSMGISDRVTAERKPELTQKKQQDAETGCRAPLS